LFMKFSYVLVTVITLILPVSVYSTGVKHHAKNVLGCWLHLRISLQ
jgi:hypothetical protein